MRKCAKCGKFHKNKKEESECSNALSIERNDDDKTAGKQSVTSQIPIAPVVVEAGAPAESENNTLKIEKQDEDNPASDAVSEIANEDEDKEKPDNPIIFALILLLIIVAVIALFFRDEILARIWPKKQEEPQQTEQK